MQCVLAMEMCTHPKATIVKIIWDPQDLKKSLVLRFIYIYKAQLSVPTTPVACGGTGHSVKRSTIYSFHP